VNERDGHDYGGLVEVVEPLGVAATKCGASGSCGLSRRERKLSGPVGGQDRRQDSYPGGRFGLESGAGWCRLRNRETPDQEVRVQSGGLP